MTSPELRVCPVPEMDGGGLPEEIAGGQLMALFCTPKPPPGWQEWLWGCWQDCLPEGRGGWGAVAATTEDEDREEERPEPHRSPLQWHLENDKKERLSEGPATGMPFAGSALYKPWSRSFGCSGVGKRSQTLEVRQTWVQVLPLPVIFSICKTGMIKLPC